MFTDRIFKQSKIVSVTLTADGTMEVVRQYPSGVVYGNGMPWPDSVGKETYAAVDGRIVSVSLVKGIHTPSHVVPETITFPDTPKE